MALTTRELSISTPEAFDAANRAFLCKCLLNLTLESQVNSFVIKEFDVGSDTAWCC
jgi:hypothetical protein